MKVTILLADSAQAIGGKLYILGGGWSVIGPNPSPMALAIKIEVPWNEANISHQLHLTLCDEDGHPIQVPTPTGDQPFEIKSSFEVGRPAGIRVGTPIDLALALNIAPLPLRPNNRYVWHCFIDEKTDENWQVSFSTRPQQTPPSA